MIGSHTSETDDFLAVVDDLDVAAMINAAFAIEVTLAHQTGKSKVEEAPSPKSYSDSDGGPRG